jgi:hypothetical protein
MYNSSPQHLAHECKSTSGSLAAFFRPGLGFFIPFMNDFLGPPIFLFLLWHPSVLKVAYCLSFVGLLAGMLGTGMILTLQMV